jgi:protein-disulfide isomerase
MEDDKKLLTKLVIAILLITAANAYGTYALYNKFTAVSANFKTANQENPSPSDSPSPNQKVEVSADNDPAKGSNNAPVTIIEFSDFQCPFCARAVIGAQAAMPQVEEKYIKTGKVKLVFRDYPLPFHENAQKAAEASECAYEQNKFWEYHDKLFTNQEKLAVTDLKKYAADLGLNAAKFNSCLDSGKMADEVKKDFADGQKAGVDGTPTFFVNGTKIVGAQPFSAFEQIIEAELKK